MKHIITVKDLVKRYGDAVTVNGISFTVEKGEVFGILGPNGAGKTTTLEMIEALRPIDGGEVTLSVPREAARVDNSLEIGVGRFRWEVGAGA